MVLAKPCGTCPGPSLHQSGEGYILSRRSSRLGASSRGSYAEYVPYPNMLMSFLFLRCSMKFCMLSLVSVLLVPMITTAQQNGTAPGTTPTATNGEAKSAVLTNAEIIRMVQAGFGEDTIVGAIQANQTQFDVSVDALVALKKAGATEKVINAMLTSETNKRNAATTFPVTHPAPTSAMAAPSPYGSRGMPPGAAAMMSPEVQAMMAQMGMAGMSGGNAAMSGGMPRMSAQLKYRTSRSWMINRNVNCQSPLPR